MAKSSTWLYACFGFCLVVVLGTFVWFFGANRDGSASSQPSTTTVAAPATTVPAPAATAPAPAVTSTAPTTTTPAPATTAPASTTTIPAPTATTSAPATTVPASNAATTTTLPAASSTGTQNFSRVQVGMGTQEVQQLLGAPSRTKQEKGTLEWEYYTDQGKLEIYFQNDKVVSTRRH